MGNVLGQALILRSRIVSVAVVILLFTSDKVSTTDISKKSAKTFHIFLNPHSTIFDILPDVLYYSVSLFLDHLREDYTSKYL